MIFSDLSGTCFSPLFHSNDSPSPWYKPGKRRQTVQTCRRVKEFRVKPKKISKKRNGLFYKRCLWWYFNDFMKRIELKLATHFMTRNLLGCLSFISHFHPLIRTCQVLFERDISWPPLPLKAPPRAVENRSKIFIGWVTFSKKRPSTGPKWNPNTRESLWEIIINYKSTHLNPLQNM